MEYKHLNKISSDINVKHKRLFIHILALILLLGVSIGVVTAWVETISTIVIEGNETIDTKMNTHASVSTSATNAIDLTSFFREAGNVHLSEASSSDGINFYFPVVDSTGSTSYRKNNINDVCVNYINFSLKVKSDAENSFVFSAEPDIQIGGLKVSNSAVRMAVTLEGESTKLFSMQASTAAVVSSASGTTSATNVLSFADYAYGNEGNNVIFSLPANTEKELTISLWLQENIADELSGKDVTVSGLTLVPDVPRHKIETTAVTNSNSKDATGGTVKVGSAAAGAYSYENVEVDSTVSLVATAESGYIFTGWYDAATGGSKVSSSTTYTFTATTDKHYYARFVTAYQVQAYAVYNGSVDVSTAGTVKAGTSTASSHSYYTVASGSNVTVKATEKTNYKFIGWYDASSDGNLISDAYSYVIENVSATTKIYAYFVDAYTYTAHAVSDGTNNDSTGGTVKLNTNTASTNSSVKLVAGETVTATAAKESDYVFEGWYTDTTTSSTKLSSSATITFAAGGKIGTTTVPSNIYAIFTPTYSVTAHAVYNSSVNDDSTGGTVKVSSGTAGATSTAESVKKGSSITVTAAVSDDSKYKFVGWYDSRTGGNQLTDNDGNDLTYTFDVTQNTDVFARFEPTGKTLYFVPSSDWNTDTPRYAAYVWGDNISAKWYSMSDGNGDGVYSVTVDAKYTKVIFCRMNPSSTSNNWDNCWNQTEDQTIPTNGNNKFTITTSYNGNNKGEGTWSKQ